MSDTSQGPGWWLASDGKWYPPELWTGPPPSGPSYPQRAPSIYPGQTRATPAAVGEPYGGQTPPQSYVAYAPYLVPGKKTNGLAIASLVCACVGIPFFVFVVPAVFGVIFGLVGRSQIRRSAGTQGGDGLALAGIIVGFAGITFFIILIVVSVANSNSSGAVALDHVPDLRLPVVGLDH
jgi:hypothetical protein